MYSKHVPSQWCVVLAACLSVALGLSARAEIVRTRANIEAQVQLFVDGKSHSLDSAFETYPDTATELPIEAAATLANPEALDNPVSAVAVFRDPRRIIDSPNPAEFGLEASCGSQDSVVNHEARAAAVETRTIRLTRNELLGALADPPMVVGRFFLSGAVVMWSTKDGSDLTGLKAELALSVTQIFPPTSTSPSGDRRELFSATLTVLGQSDGTLRVDQQGVPIRHTPGNRDVVDPNIGPLSGVSKVLLPDQVLQYLYPARPDEEFDLEARIETRVRNLPGGTGVAAAFGRPLAQMSSPLAAAVNAAQAALEPVTISVETAQADARSAGFRLPACGAFGIEASGLVLISLLPCLPRALRVRP